MFFKKNTETITVEYFSKRGVRAKVRTFTKDPTKKNVYYLDDHIRVIIGKAK
jgi:hypothetical protein